MQSSTLPEQLALPLAVVCHDAGGANQIIAWLRQASISLQDIRPVMAGPAARSWHHAFPDHAPLPNLRTALEGSAVLLSSTSWASDLEHDARCMANKLGLRSIALLDHWVNYQQRFIRDDTTRLPDELWVCDAFAESLARREFPGMPVRRIPNFYLDKQCKALPPVAQLREPHALFVCEPALSDWGRDRPGEFQALDYFIDKLAIAGIPPEVPIRIRPHPSDPVGKYDAWIAAQSRSGLSIDDSPDIGMALSHAAWVVGCESYAMVVALAAGRAVFSALPPWAPPCCLPHDGIRHLKSL